MTRADRLALAGVFGTDPHGPITVQALGTDTYRLRCDDPRHPADLTTVTSPGGVKAWRRDHQADGAAVERVRVQGGDLL